MKNKNWIFMLMMLVIHHVGISQTLLIKGTFKNEKGEKVLANYKLICNNDIINKGIVNKIKFDLKQNNDYTLIVYKDGFETHSISFSTCMEGNIRYCFEFDVCLKEEKISLTNNQLINIVSSHVYYDARLKSFSYTSTKKCIKPNTEYL